MIPAIDDDFETLFERADKALYEAKLKRKKLYFIFSLKLTLHSLVFLKLRVI